VRIITVRGLGYCLEKAVAPANPNTNAAASTPAEPEPEPPSSPSSPQSGGMPASHHYK
jgi:two-component system OmpR family response regulator